MLTEYRAEDSKLEMIEGESIFQISVKVTVIMNVSQSVNVSRIVLFTTDTFVLQWRCKFHSCCKKHLPHFFFCIISVKLHVPVWSNWCVIAAAAYEVFLVLHSKFSIAFFLRWTANAY